MHSGSPEEEDFAFRIAQWLVVRRNAELLDAFERNRAKTAEKITKSTKLSKG